LGNNALGQIRKSKTGLSRFFFVALAVVFRILAVSVARIHSLGRKSTLALRQRREHLLRQIKVFPDLLRASYVERFSVCGKKQCRCRHGGAKHGPFYYLTQSLAVGRVNKFLLKTEAQQQSARAGIDHYRQLQELVEELSQINTELVRRADPLPGA
jgi:hypothetical protein